MTGQQFFRPTGKSVWRGKDLAQSKDWTVSLSALALDEIERDLRRAQARGVTLDTMKRDDFPLTALQDELKAIFAEVKEGRGFALVKGLSTERYSEDELALIYWGIGSHFGVGMPQSFLGDRLGHIRDVSDEEPDPLRRRGYHSGGAQTTHADSCDILSMLSLRQAKSGGASRLVSIHAVHNMMLDTCPELLAVMYRGFFTRMPDSDAEAAGRNPLSGERRPSFVARDGELACFHGGPYIQRAIEAGDIVLNPEEAAALAVFTAYSNHPDLCLDMLLKPGDMQFVKNRTVFHGRAHFDDYPEKDRRRHLLRLWLSVPSWPNLDPRKDSEVEKLNWEKFAKKQAVAAE